MVLPTLNALLQKKLYQSFHSYINPKSAFFNKLKTNLYLIYWENTGFPLYVKCILYINLLVCHCPMHCSSFIAFFFQLSNMASFYVTISTVSIHNNFLILVVRVVRLWYDVDVIRYSHSQSIEIVLMDSYVRFLKLQDVQTTRFLMDIL